MLTKEEIIQKVEENKAKLHSFGVKSIALFGSYARGEAKTESDVDFLIEFKKDRGLTDDMLHTLHLLQNLFKKEVDLVKKHLVRSELKDIVLNGVKIEAKL